MKEKSFSVDAMDVLDSPSRAFTPVPSNELVLGVLVGYDDGSPSVKYSISDEQNCQEKTNPAIATVNLELEHVGRQVALMFINGDPEKPIVIGLIKSRLNEILESFEVYSDEELQETEEPQELTEAKDDNSTANEKKVLVDGEEIEIVGKEKVTFKCGLSSITLTSDGKIMIRGKYILNRSTGVNRIMGGSVQMN